MSDPHQDPSANTQAFRAFVQNDETTAPAKTNLVMIVSIAAAALIAVVVAVVLLLF